MPEKFTAYKNLADHGPDGMSFDDTLKIIEAHYGCDDQVVVDFAALPFGTDNKKDGLYTGTNGTVVYMKPKSWWGRSKARVVILTTERLPTKILETIKWKNKSSSNNDIQFHIAEWDRDYLFEAEFLPMVISGGANKAGVQELADSLLKVGDGAFGAVITDIAKGKNIISYKKARGKNDLVDKDIATILMYIGSVRYSRFNAISQMFHIPDAISLYYRDLLNQSVGRNQGFRRNNSNPQRHQLNLSMKLYHELGGRNFFRSGRYQFFLTRDLCVTHRFPR